MASPSIATTAHSANPTSTAKIMTSRDFCYWLQGFFEIQAPLRMDETQLAAVKRHLAMVFIHEIDPSMPDPSGKLQETHQPPKPAGEWPPSGEPVYRC